jgi:hypothetical protein
MYCEITTAYAAPAIPSWKKTDRNCEKSASHYIYHTNLLQRTLLRMSEILKSQHPSTFTIENHQREKKQKKTISECVPISTQSSTRCAALPTVMAKRGDLVFW